MIPLTLNHRVQDSIPLILEGNMANWIDMDSTRYLVDVSKWYLGSIEFVPFDLTTRTAIGWRDLRLFGAQTTWGEILLSQSPRKRQLLSAPIDFPDGGIDPQGSVRGGFQQ